MGGHPTIIKIKENSREIRNAEKENRKLREIKKSKTSIAKTEKETKAQKRKKMINRKSGCRNG